MRVQIDNRPEITVTVGDILQFKHSGSGGQHGFYLVCKSADKGYFIMNLSGKKSKITYYTLLSSILQIHEDSIEAIYPASEFQIKLERI